jgi:hypothetical protein
MSAEEADRDQKGNSFGKFCRWLPQPQFNAQDNFSLDQPFLFCIGWIAQVSKREIGLPRISIQVVVSCVHDYYAQTLDLDSRD